MKALFAVMALVAILLLSSCGPSRVGVSVRPRPSYYGPRPYYNPRPFYNPYYYRGNRSWGNPHHRGYYGRRH